MAAATTTTNSSCVLQPAESVNVNQAETFLTLFGGYALLIAQHLLGDDRKASTIVCSGELNEHGADSWTSIRLSFDSGRDAVILLDERQLLPNEATIGFERGFVKVRRASVLRSASLPPKVVWTIFRADRADDRDQRWQDAKSKISNFKSKSRRRISAK